MSTQKSNDNMNTEFVIPGTTPINANVDLNKNDKFKPNFDPNEIVGLRLKPDRYNWTVVLVKKHGSSSKHAGQEYEESIAYCKNISFATSYMLNYYAANEGAKLQKQVLEEKGTAADPISILKAFELAELRVQETLKDLETRLLNGSIDISKLTKVGKVIDTEVSVDKIENSDV